MKKRCTRCSEVKDIEEFNFKDKSKNIRQAQCRSCTREYVRSHYYNHRKYYLLKAKRNRNKIRGAARQYIWEYLNMHSCVDCGEKDILVLEFDHRGNKIAEIGKVVSGYYNLSRVKQEVEKCDIRCANCHRRKTAKEQGWYKSKFMPL
ncbi:hypothetical protein M1563_03395 [Patescibacteria group bacterium]|nr:hypothetical protein [Patescibacteria group bacterium]MCL5409827.1 hypothetical protein [Patescibacteria group bacterium]